MELAKLEKLSNLLYTQPNLIKLLRLLKMYKRKSVRRWWVKPHLYTILRDTVGAYSTLCNYFKLNDHKEFQSFFRISVHDFNSLHELIQPQISKQKTNVRKPILSSVRFAITLQ